MLPLSQKISSVKVDDFETRIVEDRWPAFIKMREVFFRYGDYGWVDFYEGYFEDVGVTADFAEDAAVSAAYY